MRSISKKGRLISRNGRVLAAKDPATCPCCGKQTPKCCECADRLSVDPKDPCYIDQPASRKKCGPDKCCCGTKWVIDIKGHSEGSNYNTCGFSCKDQHNNWYMDFQIKAELEMVTDQNGNCLGTVKYLIDTIHYHDEGVRTNDHNNGCKDYVSDHNWTFQTTKFWPGLGYDDACRVSAYQLWVRTLNAIEIAWAVPALGLGQFFSAEVCSGSKDWNGNGKVITTWDSGGDCKSGFIAGTYDADYDYGNCVAGSHMSTKVTYEITLIDDDCCPDDPPDGPNVEPFGPVNPTDPIGAGDGNPGALEGPPDYTGVFPISGIANTKKKECSNCRRKKK